MDGAHFIESKYHQLNKTIRDGHTPDMKLAWRNAHSHVHFTLDPALIHLTVSLKDSVCHNVEAQGEPIFHCEVG